MVHFYFSEENLTGEGSLHLLKEHINHRFIDILKNDDELEQIIVTFHQDVAPPHFNRQVRAYLD